MDATRATARIEIDLRSQKGGDEAMCSFVILSLRPSQEPTCRQRRLLGGAAKEAEGQTKSEEPVDADALPPKAETLNFIRQHSPHGDYDLLPGIIFFTERWLTKVIQGFS